jgi:hypothetical protein
MVAEQVQVRAGATADRWWRRLAPAFALAGMTGLVVWVAVDELLRQGRLGTVLGAGRAELAAPLLVALVAGTGICERIWPARSPSSRRHRPDLPCCWSPSSSPSHSGPGLDSRSRVDAGGAGLR